MSDFFSQDADQEIPENALEALVGEGKKYADPEVMAKSVLHKDKHISILEKELAELREANQKALTLEEVKTQILSQIKPPRQDDDTPPKPPVQQPEKVEDTDIEAKIAAALSKRESEQKTRENQKKVEETMKSVYGSDAKMILQEKAKELGVSLDYLAGIANDSPAAFFRMIGVDTNKSTPPTPTAPRSSTSVSPSNNSRKAFWDNMKNNNPLEYFNKANTAKRHKEMMRGELPLN